MKEYIERDYLVKEAEAILVFRKQARMSGERIEDAAATLEWLKYYAPAADAVEVVRCKDCAYGHETSGGLILCYFWQRGDSAIPALEPDAYCSYGERKEE